MSKFKVGDLVEVHPRIRDQVRSGLDLGVGMILGRPKEPPGWNMLIGSAHVLAGRALVEVFWINAGIVAAYKSQLAKVGHKK